ncbi:MAG TPA: pyridoxamine 5'-phosphate oxidase family protein [Candidatus Paceibacterota bacterium]
MHDKKSDALAFLKANHMGVLATCGSDGMPHASTVFCIADDDFNIYFLTLISSRKYKALRENPHVAFVVSTGDIPQTLQIEGTAEEIQSDALKLKLSAKLVDLLLEKSKRYFAPIVKLDSAEIVLMWIKPAWVRWGDYSVLDTTGTANVQSEITLS